MCFLTKATSGTTELFHRQVLLPQQCPVSLNLLINVSFRPHRRGKTPTTGTATRDAVETMIPLTYAT